MKGDNQISLLEFIKEVLGCKYISRFTSKTIYSKNKKNKARQITRKER